MNLKDPFIIENLLSEKYMNIIEESCIQSAWKYSNDISYGENSNTTNIVNGYNRVLNKGAIQYWLYQYLIFKSFEKINFDIKKILRIRKRLTFPNTSLYDIPYQPHVDYNFEHLSMIYYVNESDGCTFIYNEQFNMKDKNSPENYSILKKVNPQRGKIVIFNGKNYHASSLSSRKNRIILNINVTGDFKK